MRPHETRNDVEDRQRARLAQLEAENAELRAKEAGYRLEFDRLQTKACVAVDAARAAERQLAEEKTRLTHVEAAAILYKRERDEARRQLAEFKQEAVEVIETCREPVPDAMRLLIYASREGLIVSDRLHRADSRARSFLSKLQENTDG